MKNLFLLATLAAVSLGFSSCCSMFGGPNLTARYKTESVNTCGYKTVTSEVPVAGSKAGLTQTVTTRVPITKKVTRVVYCGKCVRYYCPDHDCCGSTGPMIKKLASVGGSMIGSPNLGMVPTMETLNP